MNQTEATRVAARAEAIAKRVDVNHLRMDSLTEVVRGWAAIDPAKADQVAQTIKGDLRKARALAAVAHGWSTANPVRAEEVARSIELDWFQAQALAAVARAWGEKPELGWRSLRLGHRPSEPSPSPAPTRPA